MDHFMSQGMSLRHIMLQDGWDSLPASSSSLPLAFPPPQKLQPGCKDNFFPACISSPGHPVLCISYMFKHDASLTTTPTEKTATPPPQVAAFLALSAQGICLQRACFNTPYCLSLSRLIGSFNTSVVLPAVVIIQRSWLSANSSTELAVQLPVYYSKTSAERSGDSHMPIWLWTACEVPCGTLRVKQGSKQFF